jgi:4-amino-4-deoxy-L-arabinose transferase-like glycosyltransferase
MAAATTQQDGTQSPGLTELPARSGGRLSSRLRAIPAPLAAMVAAVALIGLVWALLVPPWQSPDEDSHFAYAQSLAERFALPGDPHRPAGWSTDQALAENAARAYPEAHYSSMMRFDWNRRDSASYSAAAARNQARSNGGGPNAAAANPPLYYLYADVAYWAAYGGNAFDRLYAMRIWGVILLALTVVGGWLLAGEVFGRVRLVQLTCAATVGLIPMETFASTSVNPDALLVPLWTLALWLGARVIRRPGGSGDALALCAVTAAAILTKATSYALVPAVLLALLISWRRSPVDQRRVVARRLVLAGFALVAPVLAWLGLTRALNREAVNAIHSPGGGSGAHPHPFLPKQFASYVWQFYLPRLPFLTPFRTTTGLPLYDIWLRQGWGVFGWLEIGMPSWVYAVLTAATALVGVASAALIARFRDRLQLALVAFFGLALLGLLFGLHLTDYRSIIAGEGPLLQGRYLLPVVGLFGLGVALTVSRLPQRWRGPACGVVVAGLLLLQVLALATVAQRYYT